MANKTSKLGTASADVAAKNDEDIFRELEKIAAKASSSSAKLTYYYGDRDSNTLKNVLIGGIHSEDYTTYHKHDFFEFNYVIDGVMYEHIGGKSFKLMPGEFLIMSPGVYHTCYPAKNSACYNILLRKEWVKRFADDFKKYDEGNYLSSLASESKTYTIFSLGESSDELTSQVKKILQMENHLVHHVDLYESLAIENAAAEFLLMLTKFPRHEYNFISNGNERKNSVTPEDIIRYINDNFNKITLPDTAARFGYSTSQLHRIIKQSTGHGFSDVILSVRMQRARHYLLNTHLPIKSIAYLLGLDSAEHFSRLFKKNRGMTPKEYRDTYMRQSLKTKKKQKVQKINPK